MKYTKEEIKKFDEQVNEIIRKAEAGEVVNSDLVKKNSSGQSEVEKMMKYIKRKPQEPKKEKIINFLGIIIWIFIFYLIFKIEDRFWFGVLMGFTIGITVFGVIVVIYQQSKK